MFRKNVTPKKFNFILFISLTSLSCAGRSPASCREKSKLNHEHVGSSVFVYSENFLYKEYRLIVVFKFHTQHSKTSKERIVMKLYRKYRIRCTVVWLQLFFEKHVLGHGSVRKIR